VRVSSRRRALAFVVLALACLAGVAVAVVAGIAQSDRTGETSSAGRHALRNAESEGRSVVVFRALKAGRPQGEGQMAVSAAAQPARRSLEVMRCDRSYFAAGKGICLARGNGFAEGYEARVFDSEFRVGAKIAVDGVPSRARVSPDGRYGAVTMFVSGHSYADAGAFSTQTTLLDLRSGKGIGDLEEFAVMRGQRRVTAVDVNFWGVTFAPADSDKFYATLATAGKTYLIEGSVSARTARVIHANVECPSISPDGTRIAYKRRTGSESDPWRLTVLDLATMRETPLAETRSVDDQAEWLDDDRVLYGIDGAVWVVRADGTGEPSRYMAQADSPAVVRQ
jgi:hypothetical protein